MVKHRIFVFLAMAAVTAGLSVPSKAEVSSGNTPPILSDPKPPSIVIPPTAANHAIRRAYGVTDNGPTLFLIRPDGYIGVRSDRSQDLESWLHRVFG